MQSDMRHMQHLEEVAAGDVLAVREKEAAYRGSWKAAGGRSAWHMLRRKMDRLIAMLARPEPPEGFQLDRLVDLINRMSRAGFTQVPDGHQLTFKLVERPHEAADLVAHVTDAYCAEDIFQLIENNPTGADGTVLAEVRDLRRYLLLVEAEMIARGVVWRHTAPDDLVSEAMAEVQRRATGVARGEEPRPAPAVPSEPLVPRFEAPAAAPAFGVPGTPEDGGQHARYRLEDGLVVNPGGSSFRVFDPVDRVEYWNVWRPDHPQGEVEHLPQLRLELNNVEWKELLPEYRGMYEWSDSDNKWRVRKPYQEAWCADSGGT